MCENEQEERFVVVEDPPSDRHNPGETLRTTETGGIC